MSGQMRSGQRPSTIREGEPEQGLFATGLWFKRDPVSDHDQGEGRDRIQLRDRGREGGVDEADLEHLLSRAVEPAQPRSSSRSTRDRSRSVRRYAVSEQPFRGRYVRPVPAEGRRQDLAWDAILRRVAPRQRSRASAEGELSYTQKDDELLPSFTPEGPVVSVEAGELLRKQRLQRQGRLLLFVVDVSGSMGGELMTLARRVALTLLQDAYLRRDKIAMIAFRGRTAELLFGPTNQAELVRRTLASLPCGGTTPLAKSLILAQETLVRAAIRDPGRRAVLLLVSDGRANVGSRPGYGALLAEVRAAAQELKDLGEVRGLKELKIIHLDTTAEGKNDTVAAELARDLGATRLRLWQVAKISQDPAQILGQLVNAV